ncbi:GNAT family N-acetyltransferase [Halobacillus mangrovi]|uniref:GNAT family N-acetyltransferase n=1 Tax=Halobacillus mangrovi TaxID=402384 RepID=UPI003D99708C
MVTGVKAGPEHGQGIISVCTKGYWTTYKETHSADYIIRVIENFYNEHRVLTEVKETSKEWEDYFALDGDEMRGACGGGMIDVTKGEVFVLYIDPARRNEGIGSSFLETLTEQQLHL